MSQIHKRLQKKLTFKKKKNCKIHGIYEKKKNRFAYHSCSFSMKFFFK